MMDLWQLPKQATIGGRTYALHTDYRDILEIFAWLDDPALPEFLRWEVALTLFFGETLPEEDRKAGAEYLRDFLTAGGGEARPGPKLLDWQQDGETIVSDINRVAGKEIRALPYVHWWTFLSWFQAVGEGQLSTLVTIRDKLRRGKKLEPWETEYYRQNRSRVELKKKYTAQELAEQQRLNRLLAGETPGT